MKHISASLVGILILSGCSSYEETSYDGCVEAITISQDDVREKYPRSSEAREIENAGKIYVYGTTLLVLEKGQGLHIINNADESNPINTGFLEIPGNTDLAVKDANLYIDSFTDLVVMDISNLNSINTVFRQQDIFPYAPNDSLSDEDKAKFQCPLPNDSDQLVIGYE